MGLSPREVLWRIARTALLVIACAAALWLLLDWLAQIEDGHLLIVFALSAPLGALFAWVTVRALRTGELPYRGGVDRRDREPLAFWVGVVIFGLGAAAILTMAAWSAFAYIAGA